MVTRAVNFFFNFEYSSNKKKKSTFECKNIAYPIEPTGCGAATLFIQNIAEKDNINAEKTLFTAELKPSRSHRTNIYRIFYMDFYHCCSRVSHKRAACFESHVRLM